MKVKTKTLNRDGWRRVLEKRVVSAPIDDLGVAGLIRIDKVSQPLRVRVLEHEMTIADDGYCWLQIAPRGQNWWLTVMFDPDGKIVQYYFDVTVENVFPDNGEPYFLDLFLDVVVAPEIGMELLDEDELNEALEADEIKVFDYLKAHAVAAMLRLDVPKRQDELKEFCYRQYNRLKELIR